MAEIESWQRQNMKKSGAEPAPHQMHAKLGGGSMGLHSKIAKPTVPCGGQVMGGKQIAKYADGGEVSEETLKAEGLAASSRDAEGAGAWDQAKSSFKRLFQGNIDDPKSEAYKEYGAGRGQRERDAKAIADEAAAVGKTYKTSAELSAASDSNPNSVGAYMEAPKDDQAMSLDALRASEKDRTPAPASAPAKRQSFKDAFAGAADGSTFEWNGKKYKKEYAKPKAAPKAEAESEDAGSRVQAAVSGMSAYRTRARAGQSGGPKTTVSVPVKVGVAEPARSTDRKDGKEAERERLRQSLANLPEGARISN